MKKKRPQMAQIWMRVALSQSTLSLSLYIYHRVKATVLSIACFCSIFVAVSLIYTHTHREGKKKGKGPEKNCSVVVKNLLCKLWYTRAFRVHCTSSVTICYTHTHTYTSLTSGNFVYFVDFSREYMRALHELSKLKAQSFFDCTSTVFLFVHNILYIGLKDDSGSSNICISSIFRAHHCKKHCTS